MRCNGKWIYFENHTMKNLDKMYEWSKDHELINIELGKIRDIDKNHYKKNIMKLLIDNNDVKSICKKLDIEYVIDHYSENGYDINIIVYRINKEILLRILNNEKNNKVRAYCT